MQFHLYLFFYQMNIFYTYQVEFYYYSNLFYSIFKLKKNSTKETKQNANMDVAIFHFAIADSELFFPSLVSCRVCHVAEVL